MSTVIPPEKVFAITGSEYLAMIHKTTPIDYQPIATDINKIVDKDNLDIFIRECEQDCINARNILFQQQAEIGRLLNNNEILYKRLFILTKERYDYLDAAKPAKKIKKPAKKTIKKQ